MADPFQNVNLYMLEIMGFLLLTWEFLWVFQSGQHGFLACDELFPL